MAQDTYTMLIRGFDVLIEPSEDADAYHATVSESGSLGWEVDIPVDLSDFIETDLEDEEDLDGSDALMQYVGNAAVDLFEAQRGTLGEGATAPEVQAMKKRNYHDSLHWEDWYMKLKGTPFEDEATRMLEEYFELTAQCDQFDDIFNELWKSERQIMHELNLLNLERMKALPAGQTVIIIQGSRPKMACWDSNQLEEYLDRFIGDPLEAQAVVKIRELLDVRDQVNSNRENNNSDVWQQRNDLENQMFDLSLQAIQQNLNVPETGMEAAPNMANDLAELMEGVDLGPLEPLPEVMASRVAFEEVEPVEERVEELGEKREGLDPAEMEGLQFSFNTNDYVELKQEMTVSGPGWGGKTTYPKGTRGYAETLWDKNGNYYLMRTEDGRHLIKVRWDQIKAVPRGR